jgi:hypothetical protein
MSTKTNTNTKPNLYNDLHPTKSLKKTGFKDKKTAIKTIDLVKHRSIKYQFDVINTMYNRAKFHPNKTKNMEEAMDIFSKWLKNYKKIKKQEDRLYDWLSIETVSQFEKLANEYKVGEVSRGIKKSTKTDKGFFQMYKFVKGKAYKLQYIPVKENKPEGQDYWSYRINFINSRLAQMKKFNTPLYYTEGKYKGLPTKQHLVLILHAYSPDKKNISKNLF